MLIDLLRPFLDAASAADPLEAYRRYFDEHSPVLTAYWRNYILDPHSPQAEDIVARTLKAQRRDLLYLLDNFDVAGVAGEALARCQDLFEFDRQVDVYLIVGVGGANAGELVVGGRGIAFACLEHFTGKSNPDTMGLGLDPRQLPLWIAHEIAHAVRYTSPMSRSELARLVFEANGYYDYWDTGSQATLRELLVNEGLAVAASLAVAPGFEPRDYLGYNSGQYRRLRELETFMFRAVAPDLDRKGLGYRLRYLAGGVSQTARTVNDKVIPERAGYYLGMRMVESFVRDHGIATALRAAPGSMDAGIAELDAQQSA